ncbi:MAG TPA: hypothetical protein PK829_06375 [Promineifilum sp.]|nr:hypothetical protein [Promineifilum sp.]
MSDDIKTLKDAEKANDGLGDENSRDTEGHDGGMAWLPGLGLILVGVIFLLSNFTGFQLHNWWALFILIGAFGAFGSAISAWRSTGRFGREARGSLIGGLAILFTAAIFLFGWNWATVWPGYLILGGLAALLTAGGD